MAEITPLKIAFMGFNHEITRRALRQFAEDNREIVASAHRPYRIYLKDGTSITAISPGDVRTRPDGYRYDQLILADDARELIRIEAAYEIDVLRNCALAYSCVPEEFQIQFYNMDAPEPGRHVNLRDYRLISVDLVREGDRVVYAPTWVSRR